MKKITSLNKTISDRLSGTPVIAITTIIADISPIPMASCRQEDCTVGLKGVRPVLGGDGVAAVVATVRIVQRVDACRPVVWQEDEAIHTIYNTLGPADATGGVAPTNDITEFVIRQGAPAIVLCVATVCNGVVTPVGLARLVIQVVEPITIG